MLKKLVGLILALSILLVGFYLIGSVTHLINWDQITKRGLYGGEKVEFSDQDMTVMRIYFDSYMDEAKTLLDARIPFSCKYLKIEPPVHKGAQTLFVWNESAGTTQVYLLPVTVDIETTPISKIPKSDIYAQDTLPGRFSGAILRYQFWDKWYPLNTKYFLFLEHSLKPYNGKTSAISTKGEPFNYDVNWNSYSYAKPTGQIKEWTPDERVHPHASDSLEDIYTNSDILQYWEAKPLEEVWLLQIVNPDDGSVWLTTADASPYEVDQGNRKHDPQIGRLPSCVQVIKDRSVFDEITGSLEDSSKGLWSGSLDVNDIKGLISFTNTPEGDLEIKGEKFLEQQEDTNIDRYTKKIPKITLKLRVNPEEKWDKSCEEYIAEGHDEVECMGLDCDVCVYSGVHGNDNIPNINLRYRNNQFQAGLWDFSEQGQQLNIVDDSEWDIDNKVIVLELE